MRWKTFGPSVAEAVSGMSETQQRKNRLRKLLTPLEGGKGKFDGVLLAEMLVVQELALHHIVPSIRLTPRAIASAWTAYWALLAQGHSASVAGKMTSRTSSPAPIYMVAHHSDYHDWRRTKFVLNPVEGMTDDEPVGVVVDLKRLGEVLAKRAGPLLVEDEEGE